MSRQEILLKIKGDLEESVTKKDGVILVNVFEIAKIVRYIKSLKIYGKPLSQKDVDELLKDLKEIIKPTKTTSDGQTIKEAADASATMKAFSTLLASIRGK